MKNQLSEVEHAVITRSNNLLFHFSAWAQSWSAGSKHWKSAYKSASLLSLLKNNNLALRGRSLLFKTASTLFTWEGSNVVLCTANTIPFPRKCKNSDAIVCARSQFLDLQTIFLWQDYSAINSSGVVHIIVKHFVSKHFSIGVFQGYWVPCNLNRIFSQAKRRYIGWRLVWNWT